MEAMIRDDHADIISSVTDLPFEEWIEAITAIAHTKAFDPASSHGLLSSIVSAIELEQQCDEIRRSILTCEIDLSPHTYPFMIFRQVRIAELLLKHPAETHAHLRTSAQTKAYNVGLQDQLQLIDVLASGPEDVLRGFMVAIAEDERQRRFGACSLREICCVMAHYVDNYNAEICAIYEQYRTVPTWDEIEAVMVTGRSARKQIARNAD